MPDRLIGWLGQAQGGIVRSLASQLRADDDGARQSLNSRSRESRRCGRGTPDVSICNNREINLQHEPTRYRSLAAEGERSSDAGATHARNTD